MAQAGEILHKDQFKCPVCLDLLKDPVTLPCGHSYCMRCIKGCWDVLDHPAVCRCPQCRRTFIPRPVLGRNTILAEVVEKLKETGLQAAPPGDELTEATGALQEHICHLHGKRLEVYCRTDQRCVCNLCVMDKHKGHDTVPAAAGRAEVEKYTLLTQKDYRKRIQQREKEVQELRQAVDSLTSSAQAAVEHSESIFTQLIRSMERRRSEVKELIRAQEKAAVSQAEGVLKRLEQEIAELRRRNAELEKLKHTQDHIHLLQSSPALCVPLDSVAVPNITGSPQGFFRDVRTSLSDMREQLDKALQAKLTDVCQAVRNETVLQNPEPRTRAEFLLYTMDLTLDPNTAHRSLCLSEGNRVVMWREKPQTYPHHSDRFEGYSQVLSRESVTGRGYWEVEWTGSNGVDVAVTYKGISRKGEGRESRLGCYDKSWSLSCSTSVCNFRHKSSRTALRGPCTCRIGVYVDHSAGTLSFYSISDTMTLLHRVHTTFTQPLYAGFWVYAVGSAVRIK